MSTTTSFKIFCQPLKPHELSLMNNKIIEFAEYYNKASILIPSLKNKNFNNHERMDAYLYNKLKTGSKSNFMESLSVSYAIIQSCSNYETCKQQGDHKTPLMREPNIYIFDKKNWKLSKDGLEYRITAGSKKNGQVTFKLINGDYEELTNFLERILQEGNDISGALLYNKNNNSISLPQKINSPKYKKKEELLSFAGIDRNQNNDTQVVISVIQVPIKEYLNVIRNCSYKKIDYHPLSLKDMSNIKVSIKIISHLKNRQEMKWEVKTKSFRQRHQKEVGNRIEDIQNTTAHYISKETIKFLSKFPNPILFYESLDFSKSKLRNKNGGKSTKQRRKGLSSWNYGDVLTKIKYKLNMIGIWTKDINPAYTSQYCSHCGAKGIREGIHFMCPSCDLGSSPISTVGQYNSDVNASINIALKGIVYLYAKKQLSESSCITTDDGKQLQFCGVVPQKDLPDSSGTTTPRMSEELGLVKRKDGLSIGELTEMKQVSRSVNGHLYPFSSSYKEENKKPVRTKSIEKTDISEVLSKTKF